MQKIVINNTMIDKDTTIIDNNIDNTDQEINSYHTLIHKMWKLLVIT